MGFRGMAWPVHGGEPASGRGRSVDAKLKASPLRRKLARSRAPGTAESVVMFLVGPWAAATAR
jgi:hypothetical protein